jgi:3-oxoacyl-[acyl-carrier-protein] synthase III
MSVVMTMPSREDEIRRQLGMTEADVAHDVSCGHFAEAVSLAAQVMQQQEHIDVLEAENTRLREAIQKHRNKYLEYANSGSAYTALTGVRWASQQLWDALADVATDSEEADDE